MKRSEIVTDLAKALAKAQSQIKNAVKDSENPHYKSFYADLSSVWDVCREPLTRNGLSVVQTTDLLPEGQTIQVVLETTLLHESGQYITGFYPILPEKAGPQAMKSAVTYGKRVTLEAICGIASEDDDGEASEGRSLPPRIPIKNGPRSIPSAVQSNPVDSKAQDLNSIPDPTFSQSPPPNVKEAMKANIHDPVGAYAPTFGKYKGMMLRDITVYDLDNYCKYLNESSVASGKPMNPKAKEFLAEAEKFLNSRELPPTPRNPIKNHAPNAVTDDQINNELAQASDSFMSEEIPF